MSEAVAVDPDLELLRATAAGDQRACASLVDRHLQRLHAAASRMLGDREEAEDVCQEAFLRLWTHAANWQAGRALLSTWLYRVMLNGCNDRLRKRRPQSALDEQMRSPEPGPERQHAQAERQSLLRQALQQLPDRQREALALCHYAELRPAEAAEAMQISCEALESLLARGRRALRQALVGSEAGQQADVGAVMARRMNEQSAINRESGT